MVNNFLIAGKLGDFLHSLFAVKNLCEQNKYKANIYMVDIGWDFGIENTYQELRPILKKQEYINDVFILTDYYLDPIQTPERNSPIQVFNEQLKKEGYIFNEYIKSSLLYKTCWSEIYENFYNFKSTQAQWFVYDKYDENLKGKILVHRKNNDMKNETFPWEKICNQYKDNLIFISSNIADYDNFPWKEKMPFKSIVTLDDWFTSINSCEMIISNLTGPTDIAHALDKKRIIELPNRLDAMHCIGEEKYSHNIFWYLNENLHNLI